MKGSEVWVVESFENGEWLPIEAYIDGVDALNAVRSLKRQADDASTWRRMKYVRATSGPRSKRFDGGVEGHTTE
ncbi:MAG: hypothetical protein IPL30_11010 [Elusimicrobia bacterium]|nr:hypothetical protein [Elusimicrobiota bacterium]